MRPLRGRIAIFKGLVFFHRFLHLLESSLRIEFNFIRSFVDKTCEIIILIGENFYLEMIGARNCQADAAFVADAFVILF